ncbi:MAG: hypothetical protein U0325_35670 [Polyangiales bacterium]
MLAQGVLGMALGIVATSRAADAGGDTARLLAIGLRELANDGIFGAALAMVLGAAWLVATRPRPVAR